MILKNDIETRTHNGARTKFSDVFIKTGSVDIKFGKLFSQLSDFRQKGDYGDLFDFDDKIVLPLVDKVKEFGSNNTRHDHARHVRYEHSVQGPGLPG